MKEKIAIICPIGKTGNVVTMTLNYYLRSEEGLNLEDAKLTENAGKTVWISKDNQGKIIVTQDKSDDLEFIVIIPHTQVAVYPGVKKRKDGIDSAGNIIISTERNERRKGELQKQWNCGDWDDNTKPIIWSGTGYKWCPKIAGLHHPNYNQREPTILENIACYLIPIHTKICNQIHTSEILPDIYNISSNDQFQDLTYGLCAVLNRQRYHIHISLAGGRKTMSAYQMTSATLFPVEARLSHVLEPTIEKLNKFIEDNDLNISDRDRVLDQITAAYQPYPELYESVSVQHIDLSKVAGAIGNFLGFSDTIQRKITNEDKGPDLSLTPLRDILLNADNRRRIYEIGSIYRSELGRIDRFVAAKILQGIATGMLHSFLKHEVTPNTFAQIQSNLKYIERIATGKEVKDTVSKVYEQFELFKNTLSAIQTASVLELDALKNEVKEEGKTVKLVQIIDTATEMYQVKNSLKSYGIRLCDSYSHTPVQIKCLSNVLALAFNNIMRNFMTVIKELKDRVEQYTMTIEAEVTDGKFALRFKDDGPGFDRKKWPDLERLFDWGAMKHNQQNNQQSDEAPIVRPDDKHQGLGLPMARKIAQAHGGTLHAKDNEPHGAVFEFILPLSGG